LAGSRSPWDSDRCKNSEVKYGFKRPHLEEKGTKNVLSMKSVGENLRVARGISPPELKRSKGERGDGEWGETGG